MAAVEHRPWFTEEHRLFRETVRRFAEQELRPHAEQWERDRIFPREVFARAGELGILGAHYPEAVGGGGGDFWMSVVKAEELVRCDMAGLTMALLVQADIATPVIADVGTPEQHAEFLAPALRGERIAALGVTEPGAGSDVASIATVARRVGDEYVVSGQKTFITNGTRADFLTLLAVTDPEAGHRGLSMLLVPSDAKGYAVSRKLEKIGNHCSDTAEIFLDEVRVPRRYLLGEEGQGFRYLMQNFQSERLAACASHVAFCRLALERTADYARQRVAFGRPLLAMDHWQQRLAELHGKVEAAEALTDRACWRYNEEKHVRGEPVSPETARLVSLAKAFVADVGREVIDTCLQLHGGHGYVEEGWVARAWRDARLFAIGAGTTEVMRYAAARQMGLHAGRGRGC